MNPEENNPLANPGVPDFGMSNGQINIPGNDLLMNDGLSMAGDSLTAAGMAAAPTMNGPLNFNQIGSTDGENTPTITPNEEPLVPAAPVPGSIGSVTSVPAAAEPMANPFAPIESPAPATTGAMPAPEIEPQAAPYNPFAQTTNSSVPAPAPAPEQPSQPLMTPVSAAPVNPAFQPAPAPVSSKKSRSASPLTAILAIVCALLLISTIVFVALFINAKNNPKIVYVPTVAGGESDSQISFLSCSRSEEANVLVNDAYVVPVSHTLTMNYSNGQLGAITSEYQATFASEEDAIAGRDIYEAVIVTGSPVALDVEYEINGNVLNITDKPSASPLTEDIALTLLYGSTEGVSTTSMDDVRATVEAEGYVCTVE